MPAETRLFTPLRHFNPALFPEVWGPPEPYPHGPYLLDRLLHAIAASAKPTTTWYPAHVFGAECAICRWDRGEREITNYSVVMKTDDPRFTGELPACRQHFRVLDAAAPNPPKNEDAATLT